MTDATAESTAQAGLSCERMKPIQTVTSISLRLRVMNIERGRAVRL